MASGARHSFSKASTSPVRGAALDVLPPSRGAGNVDGNIVVFPILHDRTGSTKLFWLATATTFLIANAPPTLISAVLVKTFEAVSPLGADRLSSQFSDVEVLARTVTDWLLVPVKELLFLFALVVIVYPLWRSLARSPDVWRRLFTVRNLFFSLSLFAGLTVLVFPYAYPYGLNSHWSGLSGLGERFGLMSMAPFHEENPMYYKRLLKPALAHFIHMDGYIRYYLFSLVCTYLLIFLTVTFLNSRVESSAETGLQSVSPTVKWLLYLSLMTSSFVIVDFQWPGYSDGVSFILLLLMASVPMASAARLAAVVLCLLNHEGIALATVPVIFFCFPRRERVAALTAVGLYFGTVAAGYGFSAWQVFLGQGSIRADAGSVWQAALENCSLFLAGLFFTYKLFWLILAVGAVMLWRLNKGWALAAVLGITCFPLLLTFFAWDTTRVAGFGFLGMLIAAGLLLQRWTELSRIQRYAIVALACVNLLIPSYNVVIYYTDSLEFYPYRGLYAWIDAVGAGYSGAGFYPP